MASITTRQTAGTGATVAGVPLTNTQLDNNFININAELGQKLSTSGGTVSGNLTVNGVTTVNRGIRLGAASPEIYKTLLDFGADVAGTWRRIAVVAVQGGGALYSTVGFKIDVVDPNANHATQGSVNVDIETYYVACVRTEATTVDSPDLCVVRGPGNRIRAVKTSTGNYEIQIQNESQYREYLVTIQAYAISASHTITYETGSTVGSAGTAQYNASVGSAKHWFEQVEAKGTITAAAFSGPLSGNASTATTLQTARTINGVSFNGSADITVTANTTNTLTRGTYLTGNNFNGSAATTWAVDATTTNTASKIVARDASGNFSAGTITAALTGNASTATTLQTARTINGVSFNGSANITIPIVPSKGVLAAETLRAVHDTGIYTFNTNNASLGDSTPTGYWSTIAWGNGVSGSAQLAANWTSSGNELWFRSLRDTIDNWWGWKKIWHSGVTIPVSGGGTGTTTSTGSGSVVLSTSPTLTTPNIGIATGTSFNSITGLASAAPLVAGTASVGISTLVARQDHVHPLQTSVSGNAATATTLQTGRTINGVSFNGSANITVTANTPTSLTFNNGGAGAASGTTFNGGTAQTISYNTIGSPSTTGTNASGTWGINITGNAATATTADQIDSWVFRNTGSNSAVNADTIESNGITYYTSGVTNFSGNATDGALYSQLYSSNWQHQIAGDYRSGQIALRGKNNGTWQSWRTVLDSGNYNTYSPTLTGGGASGTWGINVTGNADTAYGLNVHTGRNNEANKVVRTDGSGYIQAGWINTTSGDNGTTAIDRVYASSDGYIRYYTPANFRQVLNVPTRTGGDASGTWGINITGNAATVSSITGNTGLMNNRLTPTTTIDSMTNSTFRTYAFENTTSAAAIATCRWNTTPSLISGLGPYGTMLAWAASDTQGFLALNYSSNGAIIGGGNGNAINWTATLLTSSNYSSYAVSTANNSSLNSDTRNTRGVTRLYRRDSDSDYSVQTYWTGSYWRLNGYVGDIGHADTQVGLADRATRANGNFYIDDNYGNGIVGVYSSTRYQGVFAMGDSYKLPADGTTTGNLYGLAWSYPGGQGGVSGNLSSHGLLVLINGEFGCALSYSIVANGNITAYSDERLKTNWRLMPTDYVARLAQVKVGIYDRTDNTEITQVGVSAQSLRNLLPEAVTEASDDMKTLSVNYGGAALASTVELAKDNVELRHRIEQLEALVQTLLNKE